MREINLGPIHIGRPANPNIPAGVNAPANPGTAPARARAHRRQRPSARTLIDTALLVAVVGVGVVGYDLGTRSTNPNVLATPTTGSAAGTPNPDAYASAYWAARASADASAAAAKTSASPAASASVEPTGTAGASATPGSSELPWNNGKYQTFPRIETTDGHPILQDIDLGTLGPDVDTIFAIDFPGNLQTNAQVIHMPADGVVTETRVVGIKRTDIQYLQFKGALGGDRFDTYKISDFGGNAALDLMALQHAEYTGRLHQKVVELHDLGDLEANYPKEPILKLIIKAQEPVFPNTGIQTPDFVEPGKQGGQ